MERLSGQAVSLPDLELGLQAWVETLLPTDQHSPGAGSLGVHLDILEIAKSKLQYQQLLKVGMLWADTEARKWGALNFADLPVEQAELLVGKTESMGLQAMPGLFFYHTLKDAKAAYYTRKESWSGVGFPHAPQPLGYIDYAEAPKS
ncbi:MAG: gluconate 2-dehydrogenase subunit 3 family protein [Lentimonas sp.]